MQCKCIFIISGTSKEQTSPTLFNTIGIIIILGPKISLIIMSLQLVKSKKRGKKYDIIWPDGRIISFGAKGYSDFTKHKDQARKKNYLARHSDENWADPTTAGFWARWLLWNKPTISGSLKDIRARFGLKIRA
ncbi:MAG: DUF5754 family protein [Gemmatimonadaceae bacterium]